jgi:MerR family mercuric resistance operon transcriptional regulator
MDDLTIGRLAKEARVNIDTLRYYEKRKLIPEPPRKESGYRLYSPDTVKRVAFIKHAKELGFSLGEITELLSLRMDTTKQCKAVKGKAEAKIAAIEEKILSLQQIKGALQRLVGSCNVNKRLGECPILEALDVEGFNILWKKAQK